MWGIGCVKNGDMFLAQSTAEGGLAFGSGKSVPQDLKAGPHRGLNASDRGLSRGARIRGAAIGKARVLKQFEGSDALFEGRSGNTGPKSEDGTGCQVRVL